MWWGLSGTNSSLLVGSRQAGDGPGTYFDRNSELLGPQLAQDAANAARTIAVDPCSPRMPSSLILAEVLVANRPYQSQQCCDSRDALQLLVGEHPGGMVVEHHKMHKT